MKKIKYPNNLITTLAIIVHLFSVQSLSAHCQIPCGIYNDHLRLQSMLEDTKTIEKSIFMIMELAGKADAQSQNQLVRWVMNKENHAQNIISTISDYYLTQRVKPSQEDYILRLENHHKVVISAMKAKQSVDVNLLNNLLESIEVLKEYYPEHKH